MGWAASEGSARVYQLVDIQQPRLIYGFFLCLSFISLLLTLLNSLTLVQAWCLTVPAMWNERDKAVMRTAALRAGLIRKAGSDALTIVSEPKAAAMSALGDDVTPYVAGMTVMVVDAGTGTVDVTIHKCQALGGQVVLSEATCCARALCGSLYVDNEFSAHYRAAVGAPAFDAWVAQHPAGLQQVMDTWEAVKCIFPSSYGTSLAANMGRLGQGLGADDLGSSNILRCIISSQARHVVLGLTIELSFAGCLSRQS
ncbi:uncharacterized protein HaLaN_26500 [Haematococcus lacustris]|uniref:Uncharacterized protein n=1 Tax=Haematococcus lacustris TaxID=44745 RepID=A0A6A0A6R0_HAELA|nr:uncharacterized protein HaLaN_26500 [Haematococcus lacustris]